MNEFYTIEQLTPADKKLLKLGMIGFIAVPIVFGLLIFFGFSWVQDKWLFSEGLDFPEYGVMGFMGILILFCAYMLWTKSIDFKTAVKHVYTGTVQDKRKSVSHSSSGGSTRRGGSRSSTTITYYIKLKDKEFATTLTKYNSVQVGDEVKLAIAPKSKVILQLDVLKDATEVIKSDDEVNTSYTSSNDIKTATLNTQDLEQLKTAWHSRLRTACIFGALPLFIIISLIATDKYGIVIFLFPLWIMVIWQSVSLLRYYLKYRTCLQENAKELIPARVIDKYSSSQNGGKSTYYLTTSTGKIQVEKAHYDLLTGNDEVIIEKAKHLATILRVVPS